MSCVIKLNLSNRMNPKSAELLLSRTSGGGDGEDTKTGLGDSTGLGLSETLGLGATAGLGDATTGLGAGAGLVVATGLGEAAAPMPLDPGGSGGEGGCGGLKFCALAAAAQASRRHSTSPDPVMSRPLSDHRLFAP